MVESAATIALCHGGPTAGLQVGGQAQPAGTGIPEQAPAFRTRGRGRGAVTAPRRQASRSGAAAPAPRDLRARAACQQPAAAIRAKSRDPAPAAPADGTLARAQASQSRGTSRWVPPGGRGKDCDGMNMLASVYRNLAYAYGML